MGSDQACQHRLTAETVQNGLVLGAKRGGNIPCDFMIKMKILSFKIHWIMGWKDGSVIKKTGCSGRRFGFDSQH